MVNLHSSVCAVLCLLSVPKKNVQEKGLNRLHLPEMGWQPKLLRSGAIRTMIPRLYRSGERSSLGVERSASIPWSGALPNRAAEGCVASIPHGHCPLRHRSAPIHLASSTSPSSSTPSILYVCTRQMHFTGTVTYWSSISQLGAPPVSIHAYGTTYILPPF
jgi:hypothetical protein